MSTVNNNNNNYNNNNNLFKNLKYLNNNKIFILKMIYLNQIRWLLNFFFFFLVMNHSFLKYNFTKNEVTNIENKFRRAAYVDHCTTFVEKDILLGKCYGKKWIQVVRMKHDWYLMFSTTTPKKKKKKKKKKKREKRSKVGDFALYFQIVNN